MYCGHTKYSIRRTTWPKAQIGCHHLFSTGNTVKLGKLGWTTSSRAVRYAFLGQDMGHGYDHVGNEIQGAIAPVISCYCILYE
jgi:hypothetical protein